MHIHAQIAENSELAELIESALAGQELSDVEARQLRSWALQYISQAHDMLRHYEENLVSRSEIVSAFTNIRRMAENPSFRKTLEQAGIDISSRLGGLILDEDGYEKWL